MVWGPVADRFGLVRALMLTSGYPENGDEIALESVCKILSDMII
jgi:hypothetical protein